MIEVEFDPVKDEANRLKHGISLSRAREMAAAAFVWDERFVERRFRIYGMIDGESFCLVGTFRHDKVRVIGLRRAHAKEYERHVG